MDAKQLLKKIKLYGANGTLKDGIVAINLPVPYDEFMSLIHEKDSELKETIEGNRVGVSGKVKTITLIYEQ